MGHSLIRHIVDEMPWFCLPGLMLSLLALMLLVLMLLQVLITAQQGGHPSAVSTLVPASQFLFSADFHGTIKVVAHCKIQMSCSLGALVYGSLYILQLRMRADIARQCAVLPLLL